MAEFKKWLEAMATKTLDGKPWTPPTPTKEPKTPLAKLDLNGKPWKPPVPNKEQKTPLATLNLDGTKRKS